MKRFLFIKNGIFSMNRKIKSQWLVKSSIRLISHQNMLYFTMRVRASMLLLLEPLQKKVLNIQLPADTICAFDLYKI